VTGSVTVPQAVSPPGNAQIRNVDQPVTLAVVMPSPQGHQTLRLRGGADTGIRDQGGDQGPPVAEGSGGRTSVVLDPWGRMPTITGMRARKPVGTTGPFTSARKFSIGPAITIDTQCPSVR